MSDPIKSVAASITQTSKGCLKDVTPPPKLAVAAARYGDFVAGNVRPDPLQLVLTGVEAGCKLQIVNLSANPAASWEHDAREFPSNTTRARGDGAYCVIIGNAEAEKVGLLPGDVFEIRQVDAAGNASEPTRVALNQLVGGEQVRIDAQDQYGVALTNGQTYVYRPYADRRTPVALPERMRIEAGEVGKGILSGDRALEPSAKVTVTNRRTLKSFDAIVDQAGKLALTFEAMAGDPLAITVTDLNGASTALGETRYAPSCVQAGPGAQFDLQQQAARG